MTRRFRLTHLDDDGRPTMVDVSEKDRTLRRAEAEGWVLLDEAVCASLDSEGTGRKGNVLRVAELAGIMAVKRTPDLIPLCHGIRIDSVSVACDLLREERRIRIRCSVTARDVTGVEMEA
ncbi:MAG TPA: cyclic pyranopterin monophosphate synthase MoaC, partial [Synergistaceae bacterium]|nr:cyclic pyranopterin monophosphate synthase MoaC [Synergistaceae bacterium]